MRSKSVPQFFNDKNGRIHKKQTKHKKKAKFAASARFFTALLLVQNDNEIIYPLTIFVTLSDSEGSRGNECGVKYGRSVDPYGMDARIALSY